MADITGYAGATSSSGSTTTPILETFKDMGGGTYARVVSSGGGTVSISSGAAVSLTGNANLSANVDNSYTFASSVGHVMIQNKSNVDLYYEADSAATLGSPKVYAGGQTIYLDQPCTVLHLYSTAATAVNGSADSNIVVRGYA